MTDADRAFCSLFEGPRLTAFANRGEVAEETKQLAVKDATERWRVVLHSCTQGLKVAKGRASSTWTFYKWNPTEQGS